MRLILLMFCIAACLCAGAQRVQNARQIIDNVRHNSNYRSAFLSPSRQVNLNTEFSFIEITTRSGNGVFIIRSLSRAVI
ncbi:MAG: hypothetical protein J0H74_24450 [Chitinophagaceae bacterium]|nr:hypothetical protein [Chitinophagaceae bacterium]